MSGTSKNKCTVVFLDEDEVLVECFNGILIEDLTFVRETEASRLL
jgi:hypothetical protein